LEQQRRDHVLQYLQNQKRTYAREVRSLRKHGFGLVAFAVSVDNAKTSSLNTGAGEKFIVPNQKLQVTDATTLPNPNSSLPIYALRGICSI